MKNPTFIIINGNTAAKNLLTFNGILQVFPWDEAPAGAEKPYVTYTTINGTPQLNMDKPPLEDSHGTQLDVWAKTGELCLQIATAVRDALEQFGHVTNFSDYTKDASTKLYRIRMDCDLITVR